MKTNRKQYIRPVAVWMPVCGEALLVGESGGSGRVPSGWTTSDPAHGEGIIEEKPENPFDDADFG